MRQKAWFKKWVVGRRTIQELSKESGKSIDTLRRLFKQFLDKPPTLSIKSNNNCHLIIDGVYFKNNFCLLNYFDNDLRYLQFCNLVIRENYSNFVKDLGYLKQSRLNITSITSDGQKGLIKAVKSVFPNVIHQRCIVHVQRMALIYLTRRPKLKPGQDLRPLVRQLHEIKNHQDKDFWIHCFTRWCEHYHKFLQERTINPFTNRWWYTHKMLRRVRSLIKNALPDMFHYLDDPQIPKSTNGLESRFSYLKNDLKIHRGLSQKNRQSFILWYLYFKYQGK